MKIVVVEDEMIIAAKISMYLTELGYEVAGIFPGAEETLHYLQSYPSDVALVDIHRSHIINLSHIDELDEHAVYIGGKMLTLSKSYQQQFLQRIKSV